MCISGLKRKVRLCMDAARSNKVNTVVKGEVLLMLRGSSVNPREHSEIDRNDYKRVLANCQHDDLMVNDSKSRAKLSKGF